MPLVVFDFVKLGEQFIDVREGFEVVVLNSVSVLFFFNEEFYDVESAVEFFDVSDWLFDPAFKASSADGSFGFVDELVN